MPRFRHEWLTAAALAVIAFTVFAPALGYEFVSFDDRDYVTLNPHVYEGLSVNGTRWAFLFQVSNWHPLTWLSLQLDATLWKNPSGDLDPMGFHLTNVLLHAANTALLFLALHALTGAYGRSAAAALLFSIHPLRVESVAWIAERKDVLSLFFGLLSLWAYACYVRGPSTWRYLAVVLALALSLMAKPTLVTLPFLLLVLDWWPLRRVRSFSEGLLRVREKIPLFVLVAFSSVLTYLAQEAGGATRGWEAFSLAVRAQNAAVSYVAYLAKTFWPVGLAPFYPHPGAALLAWQAIAALVIIAGITAGTLAYRQRAPYLLTGWLWFLGTLVPAIGLVQVGNQAYADRYTYFPQIGILVASCWAVADVAAARPRLIVATGALAALLLMVRTENQLPIWHDSFALWQHTLQVTPANPTSLISLGTVEEDRGHPDKAEALYLEAIDDTPDSELAHTNLGNLLARQRKWQEAETHFTIARELAPKSATAHTNLGKVLFHKGMLAEAAREQEEAIELAPNLVEAYYNLAQVELALDHPDKAAERFRDALRLQPNFPEVHYFLATILLRKGSTEEAIEHLREAVRGIPGFAEAHLALGEALEKRRDFEGAVRHSAEAVRLRPRLAEAWFHLGTALVSLGRAGDAEQCLTKAAELMPDSAAYQVALATLLYDLAAAQARDGHPLDAADTARRARGCAEAGKRPDLASKIEANLQRYERGETGRSPSGRVP
jgi:tetratricopeptide (TPR) repeat protein